jgi:hypothetical protein
VKIRYLFCEDCECEIHEGEDYWEIDNDIVCENCYDNYLKELKRDNRKTFERDCDNEIDEILMERGE